MKIEKNSKYLTICIYAISSILLVMSICLIFINFNMIYNFIFHVLKKIFLLFKPLIYALIFAYLTDPIVEFYEKKCKINIIRNSKENNKRNNPYKSKVREIEKQSKQEKKKQTRTMPVILTLLTLLVFIAIFILMIVTNVKNALGYVNFKDVMDSINNYVTYFENVVVDMNDFMNHMFPDGSNPNVIIKIYHLAQNLISNTIHKGVNTITSFGTNAVNIGMACVIAFYLLKDKYSFLCIWNRLTEKIFPKRCIKELRTLGRDLDSVFSRYIRGQIIDSGIIAVLTSIGLTLIRLDFAIIIGIIVGVFNLIPYFGPIVGEIIAGIIGLASGKPLQALYAVLTVLAIQQLDAFYIVPKVIGGSVNLHPVIVLISLFIGGNLFGLAGMLLAVPVAAFIRLLLIRYMGDIFSEDT